MEKEERRLGIIDIYERFHLMLDEIINDIKRKINDLANKLEKLDDLTERIARLEDKIN